MSQPAVEIKAPRIVFQRHHSRPVERHSPLACAFKEPRRETHHRGPERHLLRVLGELRGDAFKNISLEDLNPSATLLRQRHPDRSHRLNLRPEEAEVPAVRADVERPSKRREAVLNLYDR